MPSLDQAPEWKRLAVQAGGCLVLLLAGVMLERHGSLKWLAIACYTGSMIAGGVPLPLTWGVVAHEGSTLIVCLNSLRLIFHKDVASAS